MYFREGGTLTVIYTGSSQVDGSYSFPSPGEIEFEMEDGDEFLARYTVEGDTLTFHAFGVPEPDRYVRLVID